LYAKCSRCQIQKALGSEAAAARFHLNNLGFSLISYEFTLIEPKNPLIGNFPSLQENPQLEKPPGGKTPGGKTPGAYTGG
jgi:hypothetical protein